MVKFVHGIPSVGIFEQDFLSGDLAENDAHPTDAEAVEAFERTLQALDVALAIGKRAECETDAALGLRGQGDQPCGHLLRGRNSHRPD